MQPKEHANLISIFSWIVAAIQAFLLLLYGIYLIMMIVILIAAIADVANPDARPALAISIIFSIGLTIVMVIGIASLISNVRMALRLKKDSPPEPKSLKMSSMLNFASFFCGGIFSVGLGVYGLWFATSDQGKWFLSGSSPTIPSLDKPSAPNPPHGWR